MLKTLEEVEQYFPDFIAFTDCTEQQIPRHEDKRRRKAYYSGKKKRHTVKNRLWLITRAISFTNQVIRKEEDMTMIFIKRNHPVIPKEVVNVYDLGYFGVGKDFPEQLYIISYKKKRNLDVPRRKRVE